MASTEMDYAIKYSNPVNFNRPLLELKPSMFDIQCPLRSHLLSSLSSHPTTLPHLHQILALALTSNLWPDPFISARFIAAACSTPSHLPLALLAFNSAPNPSAFAHTVLIRALSPSPAALPLFRRMLAAGLYPDRFSLPALLPSIPSSSLPSLHALALRHGLASDPHTATSLLHSYASAGHLSSALHLFHEMPCRTSVTWNAIISATSHHHQTLSLSLFANMLSSSDATINADTLTAALSCCDALTHGKTVHAIATRLAAPRSREVSTSLIRMYARCGRVDCAARVFDSMEGGGERDAAAWTAMVGALAMHGRGRDAVAVFERMVNEGGVAPDSMAFTSVLHACSHSGMVETGMRIFDEMWEVYGVEARMEHYGAVVDMLGRAGRIEEAERVVEAMPFEPNEVVWGSLLHACLVKGGMKLRKQLERRLVSLALEGGGFCVGVSNGYAQDGRWDEVERVRERMVENGVRKERGYSLVEVNGRMHGFLVGDTRHPLTEEMGRLLCGILGGMS